MNLLKKVPHPNPADITMRFYLESYGCSMNQSLGEYLEGRLEKCGLEPVEVPDGADVIILNTCTVKGKTERRISRRIRDLQTLYRDRRLVIAGCMSSAQPELLERIAPRALRFGTYEYSAIPEAIGARTGAAEPRFIPYHERRFARPGIGIVPVSTGCLGECSYCVVRLIKGKLRSYPADDILKEVDRCRKQGCHELWLTSQDLSAYGCDADGLRAPGLIRSVLGVAGDMRIRLGMMNPSTTLPLLGELVETLDDPRVYRFIHLPIQSGSDRVLESMRRGYCVRDWMRVVKRLRASFPDLTVSTDLIVGYPEETSQDFEDTISFLQRARPDIVNVSRYEHRPGTPSSRMKGLEGKEVKRRSRIASGLVRRISLESNNRWLGWKGRCLVSEVGKRKGFIARNHAYKPIVLAGSEQLGSRVQVNVERVTWSYLIGEKVTS